MNPEKAAVLIFSNRNKISPPKSFKIFHKQIKIVDQFKYLGVIFDKKLLWKEQLKYIIEKGNKALWASRRVVAKMWGLTPKNMMWVYKQIIIPRITYGCVIWWKLLSNKANVKALDSLQRKALMLVTGAVSSTPLKALEALLSILPIDIHIKQLSPA